MELSPEDAKLVTLARAARARRGVTHGAAVRDDDGRTYAASTVALASVHVDALDLAVAMAVSSGARSIEAAAVVTDLEPDPLIRGASVRDVAGAGIPVYVADPSGAVAWMRET